MAMSQSDAYTDVVELCALLQCLGFSVKTLETIDENIKQDGGSRTVVINCQSSGLHVVLESSCLSCSCPATNAQNSGVWQVAGVSGGKQIDKEFGWSMLGSLPKTHRDRLTKELHEMIRCIKDNNESDVDHLRERESQTNKSNSMNELKTPEKIEYQLKNDTPTRYRSLDTLTAADRKEGSEDIPAPGPLQKSYAATRPSINITSDDNVQKMCGRQSTYTLSSTPGNSRIPNKTSSPIKTRDNNHMANLIAAEKAAVELCNKLTHAIKEFVEDENHDSSMSSLMLDVSKISVLKGTEPTRAQFASSPNLSAQNTVQEDYLKSKFKKFESASTSNLAPHKSAPAKEGGMSRLRRISPNIFKKKADAGVKTEKSKPQENKNSKFSNLFGPRIVTPVRTVKTTTEPSLTLSASKGRYSHVKSTIPRPAKKE